MFGFGKRKFNFQEGDAVKAVAASRKWGDVTKGSIGFITEVDHTDGAKYAVSFKQDGHWHANDGDLVPATAAEARSATRYEDQFIFSEGDKVRLVSMTYGQGNSRVKVGDIATVITPDFLGLGGYALNVHGKQPLFIAAPEDIVAATIDEVAASPMPEKLDVKTTRVPGGIAFSVGPFKPVNNPDEETSGPAVLALGPAKKPRKATRKKYRNNSVVEEAVYDKLRAMAPGDVTYVRPSTRGKLANVRKVIGVWASHQRKTGGVAKDAHFKAFKEGGNIFIRRIESGENPHSGPKPKKKAATAPRRAYKHTPAFYQKRGLPVPSELAS